MAHTFQPGDVVRLKSGGPVMTVEGIDKYGWESDRDRALCKWFEGKNLKEEVFELTSLEKVK